MKMVFSAIKWISIAWLMFAAACGGSQQSADASEPRSTAGGWCSCVEIEGKCRVERNSCKEGYVPRCFKDGDECGCECVQKS
jgi:hypothetical protein